MYLAQIVDSNFLTVDPKETVDWCSYVLTLQQSRLCQHLEHTFISHCFTLNEDHKPYPLGTPPANVSYTG